MSVGVYPRGRIKWITYIGPDGQQKFESTGQTDARIAARELARRKREVLDGTWQPRRSAKRVTVAVWAETWLERVRARQLKTVRDIEQRCRAYVLPALGAMPIDEVRPRHVIAFVETLNTKMRAGELAPRTVHHIFDVLRWMCRDAQIEELIIATPCVLVPGTLPPKRDKDPTWRARALYTRPEFEQLIGDVRIPDDRRTFYALMFLTGMRFGETAGRRWRDYDPEARPLGRLLCATQYDDDPLKSPRGNAPIREIPVHAVLAALLARWKLHGFGAMLGRSPKPDDLVVPSRRGLVRSVRHMHRKMGEDCERLGLRKRRQHDTRRTFISLCRADGARKDVHRAITHGEKGDTYDGYTSWPWETLCEAVSCLRIGVVGASAVASIAAPADDKKHDSDRGRNENALDSQGEISGVDGTRTRPNETAIEGSGAVRRGRGGR